MSQSLSLDLGQPEQVWLDTVWSITILGRATPHHLQSVLTPAFHTSTSTQATLKLLNINAAAKLLYPDYQGRTTPAKTAYSSTFICRTNYEGGGRCSSQGYQDFSQSG